MGQTAVSSDTYESERYDTNQEESDTESDISDF